MEISNIHQTRKVKSGIGYRTHNILIENQEENTKKTRVTDIRHRTGVSFYKLEDRIRWRSLFIMLMVIKKCFFLYTLLIID